MGAIDKERLLALIEQERDVLIDGDYDVLPELGRRKEKLVNRAAPDLLQELMPLFERNQAMLGAAIEGARSARESRAAWKEVQAKLHSYTASGGAKTITSGASGLVKRA